MTIAPPAPSGVADEAPIFALADLAKVPQPPRWFHDAITAPFEADSVLTPSGVAIEARYWGDPAAPGLLLVHGSAAHHGWWSFLAPFFADRYRVATFSLGGMGASGWRRQYSAATFAEEMWAVADAAGMTAGPVPPIIVAHSMGGFPLIHSAASLDRPIRAAVLVDVSLPDEEVKVPGYSGHRLYPSIEAALARFRLSPSQPFPNGWIAEYLGREALKPTTGPDGEAGWTWRFDPALWGGVEAPRIWEELAAMRCPTAMIQGGLSTLTQGRMDKLMRAALPPDTPVIVIPEAHHHVMIDQPTALVVALKALFETWVRT